MQLVRLLREPEVLRARGRARSTHWNDIKEGLCTRAIRTGPRSAGWPESEIAAINKARIAGKSEDEIRALVKRLEARRQDDTDEDEAPTEDEDEPVENAA